MRLGFSDFRRTAFATGGSFALHLRHKKPAPHTSVATSGFVYQAVDRLWANKDITDSINN